MGSISIFFLLLILTFDCEWDKKKEEKSKKKCK